MSTEHRYSWRHGWVPLTMRAALQKTRGNAAAARRLLGQPTEFVTPHPSHQVEHAARTSWRALTDDQLAEHLADADAAGVTAIVAELDRRDRVERKAQRDRERRAARRQQRDAARWSAYEAAVDAGTDPSAAYAEAFGVTEERQRRDEVSASLAGLGYAGRGFTERARSAFKDHAAEHYAAAEDECRGHLLSKAGEAAGVHPLSLFTGPETRARKYASEDLLGYWQSNGRPTLDDFVAGMLGGGSMRSSTTAAWL